MKTHKSAYVNKWTDRMPRLQDMIKSHLKLCAIINGGKVRSIELVQSNESLSINAYHSKSIGQSQQTFG